MTVSIIIPARTITIELKEALPHLLALKPMAEEIIVVLDQQPAMNLRGACPAEVHWFIGVKYNYATI